ncbi:MAG TPA: hypothetical protein PKC36_15760, partial [Dietzia sp.]|nr:hypothetical protein [Dietzia sp.]
MPPADGPRSAAVLGHPVDHSLSPVLHGAAYRALGLDGVVGNLQPGCEADFVVL